MVKAFNTSAEGSSAYLDERKMGMVSMLERNIKELSDKGQVRFGSPHRKYYNHTFTLLKADLIFHVSRWNPRDMDLKALSGYYCRIRRVCIPFRCMMLCLTHI